MFWGRKIRQDEPVAAAQGENPNPCAAASGEILAGSSAFRNKEKNRKEHVKMEYILSLSYGKDSLACLGAIKYLGLPLDRIITAEVWATDYIPGDLPLMVEFKNRADQIIYDMTGICVEHVRSAWTYESYFYKTRTGKSKYSGIIYGFPMLFSQWCSGRLKTDVLNKYTKGSFTYLGIASDESERIKRHSKRSNILLPLVDAGWSENYCRLWCEEHNLLSPIYTSATRSGCWFCHNQSVGQLRNLRFNHPEYWDLLLKWDKDSPFSFNASGHTVHDYEERFKLEDEGLLFPDEYFSWNMLRDECLNYRLF